MARRTVSISPMEDAKESVENSSELRRFSAWMMVLRCSSAATSESSSANPPVRLFPSMSRLNIESTLPITMSCCSGNCEKILSASVMSSTRSVTLPEADARALSLCATPRKNDVSPTMHAMSATSPRTSFFTTSSFINCTTPSITKNRARATSPYRMNSSPGIRYSSRSFATMAERNACSHLNSTWPRCTLRSMYGRYLRFDTLVWRVRVSWIDELPAITLRWFWNS
mmetsp:Transcript_37520/g.88762  ORF Transcript_37520/g.88762 Transcript_37520/m.88762 type:complete len:227 (+) Transcript_37520:878-1558(+)